MTDKFDPEDKEKESTPSKKGNQTGSTPEATSAPLKKNNQTISIPQVKNKKPVPLKVKLVSVFAAFLRACSNALPAVFLLSSIGVLFGLPIPVAFGFAVIGGALVLIGTGANFHRFLRQGIEEYQRWRDNDYNQPIDRDSIRKQIEELNAQNSDAQKEKNKNEETAQPKEETAQPKESMAAQSATPQKLIVMPSHLDYLKYVFGFGLYPSVINVNLSKKSKKPFTKNEEKRNIAVTILSLILPFVEAAVTFAGTLGLFGQIALFAAAIGTVAVIPQALPFIIGAILATATLVAAFFFTSTSIRMALSVKRPAQGALSPTETDKLSKNFERFFQYHDASKNKEQPLDEAVNLPVQIIHQQKQTPEPTHQSEKAQSQQVQPSPSKSTFAP